ncbi:unnamed protein product [Pleuronectes platessa]|uniref:Uncharacterized protein n=1 Tax=Pleuronectes platessa TaxID=8262 RepID=A0A9N7V0J3_PLEPL|nr:unnamed protein product [Pleuronectes platessa]
MRAQFVFLASSQALSSRVSDVLCMMFLDETSRCQKDQNALYRAGNEGIDSIANPVATQRQPLCTRFLWRTYRG